MLFMAAVGLPFFRFINACKWNFVICSKLNALNLQITKANRGKAARIWMKYESTLNRLITLMIRLFNLLSIETLNGNYAVNVWEIFRIQTYSKLVRVFSVCLFYIWG